MTFVLHARNLSKSYPSPGGEIPVLREVDLDIATGESVSIRGESGSGKTTLLYCLAGLEQADQGELEWEGRPVGVLGAAGRARARSDSANTQSANR